MTDHGEANGMSDHDTDARSIEQPKSPPPDEGKAYDPEMTDADEANIPPESDADPDSEDETHRG